jgi:ribosomal protein S18 acetylase RimI-like enzyme
MGNEQDGAAIDILIDSLSLADVDALMEIDKSADIPADQWPEEAFEYLLREPGVIGLGARIDGALVGFIVMPSEEVMQHTPTVMPHMSDVQWHFGNMAVKPEYRHLGIATRLFESFLEQSRARGLPTSCILEVPAINKQVVGFYEQFGFERVETRWEKYRSGRIAVIMRRNAD